MDQRPNQRNATERRAIYSERVKSVLSRMTPSVGAKFSGQQLAYAKGRAWQQMREEGF